MTNENLLLKSHSDNFKANFILFCAFFLHNNSLKKFLRVNNEKKIQFLVFCCRAMKSSKVLNFKVHFCLYF